MSKEWFMDAHEALIDEYMEAHPNASWQQAYDRTADGAYDRMTDTLADAGDHYRDQMKERGL